MEISKLKLKGKWTSKRKTTEFILVKGFAEQERKLFEQIRDLQSQLEKKDEQHRQKEWRFTDQIKENEIKCQR